MLSPALYFFLLAWSRQPKGFNLKLKSNSQAVSGTRPSLNCTTRPSGLSMLVKSSKNSLFFRSRWKSLRRWVICADLTPAPASQRRGRVTVILAPLLWAFVAVTVPPWAETMA